MMNQAEIERLAAEMARTLGPGGRIFLTGELGSGKSVFARAVLRELGVKGPIPSPSFIVDAVYSVDDLVIHHIDLYRLSGTDQELEFYGIEEALDSNALVVVEWADRLDRSLTGEGICVDLSFSTDPLLREVSVNGRAVAGN